MSYSLPFRVSGGASEDCLCFVSSVDQDLMKYEKGHLRAGDLILEVQGEKVAGFILQDLLDLLWSSAQAAGGGWVSLKTVSEDFLSRQLTSHLGRRFPPDSLDYQLQQTIRRNIYKRALPYTTRPPREDELDGVDYKFLSVEEFLELERSGKLLEKGVYEGNYYGTPKPDVVVSHIIPWSGLPEHLYSMVSKHNSSATVTATLAAAVASTASVAGVATFSTFCHSLSPSPRTMSSNSSSANTTLVSPMNSRRDREMICQLGGVRDNEDALNNNNDDRSAADPSSSPANQRHACPKDPPSDSTSHCEGECHESCDQCHGTQLVRTVLIKGARGLGFTIVGVEDEETGEVWLVVKNVMEGGPAHLDGKLMRGDILVRVDERSICGMSHSGVVQMFRQLRVDQPVSIDVLRTPNSANLELLDLDPCDPSRSLEVISTVAGSDGEFQRVERIGIDIVKGRSGFGFTLADRPEGQKVKQLVDLGRCRGLEEGDLLLEINDQHVGGLSHPEVVTYLKACPVDRAARFVIERRVPTVSPRSVNCMSPVQRETGVDCHASFRPMSAGVGSRSSPLDLRRHVTLPQSSSSPPHASSSPSPSLVSNSINNNINDNNSNQETPVIAPSPKLRYFANRGNQHTPDFIPASAFVVSSPDQSGEGDGCLAGRNTRVLDLIPTCSYAGQRSCSPLDVFPNYSFRQQPPYVDPHLHIQQQQQQHQMTCQQFSPGHCLGSTSRCHPSSCESLHFSGTYQHFNSPVLHQKGSVHGPGVQLPAGSDVQVKFITLKRSPSGFGFRIVGGREEGTQVSVGYIVPGGPAHRDGRLKMGQEIVSVDGRAVIWAWHKEIVDLVTMAGQKGEITIGVTELGDLGYELKVTTSHEVVLNRGDGDGFGFYILSSAQNAGSVIGKIIENSPAHRAQDLKVGDRILAINDVSIHGMKHDQIVQLIKSSGRTIKLTVCEGTYPHSLLPPHQHPGAALGGIGPRCNSPCLSISPKSNPSPSSPLQQLPLPPPSSSSSFPPPPLNANCCPYPPVESSDVTVIQVELIRGPRGFGFSIRGGQDFGLPIYILKITEDGPAKADGRLQAGDEILKINGRTTSGMAHREAINLVQMSAHRLALVVRRDASLDSAGDL